jgi:protein gp37
MSPKWARKVRSECRAHDVPFFFKQWGGVRKSETGRMLDGKTYDEFPRAPFNAVAGPDERAELLATIGAH